MTVHDFTYTGGDSGVPYQVQQYDRLDRAVTQTQYYFDSVRAWRQDAVNYATQARQDRDHIQTLGDTIASTGQHIDTRVQVAIDAADTATTAASNTATDRKAAQTSRTGAETAETGAKNYASDAASSASSAADILTATESLGITVDTTVGTRVYVGDTMIYGDTGYRDVRSLLINGWTASGSWATTLRRVGDTCELKGYIFKTDATDPNFMANIPGFRPGGHGNVPATGTLVGTVTPAPVAVDLSRSNGFRVMDYQNAQRQSLFSITWITNDPWPASLPGIPF